MGLRKSGIYLKDKPITDHERQLASNYYKFALRCGRYTGPNKAPRTLDDEDIGVIHGALIEAVRDYHPSKGKLSTRISFIINQRLAAAFRKRLKASRLLPLSSFEVATGNDGIATIDRDDLIADLFTRLPTTRLREMFHDRYRRGLSRAEIAEQFGLSEPRVSVIISEGLDDIRRSLEAGKR